MPSRDYDFQGFDRIRISGDFELSVNRADTFSVHITSDPLKVIRVSRDGDTLRVGLAWYTYIWGFLTWWSHPRAVITMPELRELRMGGACRGEVGDFATTHDFSVELVGASRLRLGSMETGNADFRLRGASVLEFKKVKGAKGCADAQGASRVNGEFELDGDIKLDIEGASRLELSGKAGNAVLNARGASRINLQNFTVKDARLKVAGASNAVVNAEGRLDIDAAGASSVSWVGNPTMGDVRSGGASTLHKV